jgi:hypothetical protein
MATWPSVSAGVTVQPSGSTIRWGTGNTIASTIVLSVDERQKTDKIYVEQGDGVEATRFIVNHGKVWDITCIDSGIAFSTPPTVGGTITLIDIIAGTGSGASMTANSSIATVIDNNYKAARKVEGQRVISCENLTCIEGAGYGGVGT